MPPCSSPAREAAAPPPPPPPTGEVLPPRSDVGPLTSRTARGCRAPHPPRRGGNFCHQAARREAQKPPADDLFSSILGRARGRRLPWVRSKPVAHPRSKGRGAGWGHHAVLELLSTSMCPSSHTRRPPPSYISAR